ncbi:MAG: DUF2817 domain-containing protein [Sinobacteraceae bacterium]|nr:DUF2817 domain-containing protein [Nevskiaceae bacterium]
MESSFSLDYKEARERFVQAAAHAGATCDRRVCAARGPDGAELWMDTAWLGEESAAGVLVTISGTHGVEGFFGSAVQIEWLRRAAKQKLPAGIAVLHIHALNPYGFAWLRRTNENNIDINRNWVDFGKPPESSQLYEQIADDLCPSDWSEASQAQTRQRLNAWIANWGASGLAMYQKAVSEGQWKYPKGLFYGGRDISWSRQTLTDILQGSLRNAARVCVLDFHTGLGQFGYAEPIIGVPRSDARFQRAKSWIGAGLRSLFGDGSVSAEIKGDSLTALQGLLPHAQVDAIALECGIKPVLEVEAALRAECWLHGYGDPLSTEGRSISERLRGVFHSDDPLWQGMALGQGLAACQAAICELTPQN